MIYDFTAQNNLLVVTTRQESGAYLPEEHTYHFASTELGSDVINLMESGNVKLIFRIHEIGDIDGVPATDLEDANEKIKNLIPTA